MFINQEETPLIFPTPSGVREAEGSSAMMYDVTMNTYKKLDIPNNDRKS